MSRLFWYRFGRATQLAGLIAMPFAIAAAEIQHSEKRSITIFLGSLFIFLAGTFVVKRSR